MTVVSDLPMTGPQSPDLSLFFFFSLPGVEEQTVGFFFLFFFLMLYAFDFFSQSCSIVSDNQPLWPFWAEGLI